MHERDLCSLFLLTDRRLNKAFFEDMRTKGVVANTYQRESEETLDEGVEEAPGKFLQQDECGRVEVTDLEEDLVLARSSFIVSEGLKGRVCKDPPPAGAATKTFIKDVLPELERISRVIERWA